MSTRAVSTVFLLLSGSLIGCGGGGGGGGRPPVSPTLSSIVVVVPFGTPADGTTTVEVVATILDPKGIAQMGVPVEIRSSGAGNVLVQPPVTDANGVTRGTIASLVAEKKSLYAAAFPGPKETLVGPASIEFVRLLPDTFFVRSSGSDSNSGAAPLEAWRTLAHALSQAGPGDTVYVGAGTYDPIEIPTVASEEDPLLLRADPSGLYTGDAGDVIIDAGGTGYGVRFRGARFVILRGFIVRGAAASGGPGAGVWMDAPFSECCFVVDASIHENALGIDVVAARGFFFEGSRVSNNLGHGLVVGTTSGVTLLDNLVYGNAGNGLLLDGSSASLSVGLNTFHGNGLDQILEATPGSTGLISDNVFSEGMADGIELGAGSSLVLSSNLAWANVGVAYQTGGGILPPSNVVGDPRFVDPDGADGVLGGIGAKDDDFHVQGASAALDAGDLDARDLWLGFPGAAASLTTRFDQEYDGQGTDGDRVNLGHHYPVVLDPLSALPAEGGRALWALPDDVVAHGRTWTRSNSAWGPSEEAVATNREARSVLHRVAPTLQPDELLAMFAETGSGTQLFVRHWDGWKWSETTEGPLTTAIPSASERGFDVELERPSGEALVVWSTGGPIPSYRRFSNGVWNDAAQVYPNPAGAGAIRWVELVPAFQGDRMALVTLDDQLDLVATPWDGNAWGAPTLLESQVIAVDDYKAFDVAIESQSGDLVVMWGYSVFTEMARFATLGAVSGQWTFGLHPATEAVGSQVLLASDPASDRIVAAFGEAPFDDDVTISVWDGSLWTNTREVTLLGEPGQRSIDVGWIGNTGRAFGIWRDANLGGSFDLAIWDGVWKIKPEVSLAGVGEVVQIESRPVPGENRSLLLLLDEVGALFGVSYDGSKWTVQNGGMPLDVGLDPLGPTRLFSFDLRD